MPRDNIKLVTAFIEAWRSVNIDKIMEFISCDCMYHNIPMPMVQGYDAIKENLLGFIKPVSEIEWVLYNIAETNSGVILTERLDRFRTGDRWIELPVMGSFIIESGKINYWRDYFDLGQFVAQSSAGSTGGDEAASR